MPTRRTQGLARLARTRPVGFRTRQILTFSEIPLNFQHFPGNQKEKI
jgi:hypothetical protein